jgi:competence ComEA-like helix-hairpin-helix protein
VTCHSGRRQETMVRRPQIVVSALLFLLSIAVAAAQKKPPAKPVDLNTTTLEQLERLPGIGPATAKRILEMREKSGAFRRVEDLLAVRGISRRRLESLRPYVTVSPPPSAPKQ